MSDQLHKSIELSNCQVKIKQDLTWGDQQRLEASMASGARMKMSNNQIDDIGFSEEALVEAKLKLLEILVIEVKTGDKTEPFTRNWVNNLSIADGNKLYEAVEDVTKKKT